jgi:hypothetical protein
MQGFKHHGQDLMEFVKLLAPKSLKYIYIYIYIEKDNNFLLSGL